MGIPPGGYGPSTFGSSATGSVTSIATTGPISGGTITTTGTISCATCVTSAAALTLNSVVLGAGLQAEQTLTFLTTDGVKQLNIGVVGGGSGVVGFVGNVSGTATITGPATAGTSTNAFNFSNIVQTVDGNVTSPSFGFNGVAGWGMYRTAGDGLLFTVASTATLGVRGGGNGTFVNNTSGYGWVPGSVVGSTGTIDTAVGRVAAGVVSADTTTPGNALGTIAATNYRVGTTKLLIGGAAPTITTGAGASIADNNGTGAFTINVGTGGLSSIVIGLPTATTGWHCLAVNRTTLSATVFITKQTNSALSTTGCTIGNFTNVPASGAWNNNDLISVHAFAD